jgi:hypothetical protein
MTARIELWLLALVQAIATALMLVATALLKIVVWQALKLGESRAAWQLPLAGAIALVALPIILASVGSVRRLNLERLGPWFAIVFLLAVSASSAQAIGACRLYFEKVP